MELHNMKPTPGSRHSKKELDEEIKLQDEEKMVKNLVQDIQKKLDLREGKTLYTNVFQKEDSIISWLRNTQLLI